MLICVQPYGLPCLCRPGVQPLMRILIQYMLEHGMSMCMVMPVFMSAFMSMQLFMPPAALCQWLGHPHPAAGVCCPRYAALSTPWLLLLWGHKCRVTGRAGEGVVCVWGGEYISHVGGMQQG
jgi:hypothetical protein